MRDAPNLNRLAYFIGVVEAGSFTAAAERLGIAKTVVSHQVSRLEEELQATLLKRTTRKLQLTETGRSFYDRAVAILRDAEEAFGEATRGATIPTGTLTVTAPVEYGQTVVARAIAAFLQRFPHLNVEVKFDDALVDLVSADFDIAIRLGWLADSTHQMRKLGSFRQLLVCAPSLARSSPEPQSPADLEKWPWIGNRVLKHPLDWTFSNAKKTVALSGRAAVMADMTPAAYACVLAGAGITVLPDFMVQRDLTEGRLIHVLPQWSLPEGGIYAVYPAARFRPARVRHFVDLLIETDRQRIKSAADKSS